MKFTETHEWITVEGDVATVGITDHAQHELGDIVYVELPEVGKRVKTNDEAAVLESTKAAADVYSPVTGTIVEVNTKLNDQSDLVNQSAEEEGWLFKVSVDTPEEIDTLMSREQYTKKFS